MLGEGGAVKGAFRAANSMDNRRLAAAAASAFTTRSGESSAKWGEGKKGGIEMEHWGAVTIAIARLSSK